MDGIINFGLLKNPMNWIIVITMLVIAAIAGHLFLELFGYSPATSSTGGGASNPATTQKPSTGPADTFGSVASFGTSY